MKTILTTALLTLTLASTCLSWAESSAPATPDSPVVTETPAASAPSPQPMSAEQFVASLHKQTGKVTLPGDIATLDVPASFYYLSPADAAKVLVDAWGNPPGQDTLGMLFPAGMTPLDDNAWGVNIQYEEEGHVEDDDADTINYDDLLTQMKDDMLSANDSRKQAGYPGIELVGWAEPPHYDKEHKKLYWAKELKFDGVQINTLNYNVRILGRKGVLVMNFVAGMDQLAEINRNIDPVMAMANFNQGHRYLDFDPSVDKVAAYGIGALIAGKVLAKTGLFVGLLLALKKFWILLLAGLFGGFKTLFRRKKEAPAQQNIDV